jgi:hypothetical protein
VGVYENASRRGCGADRHEATRHGGYAEPAAADGKTASKPRERRARGARIPFTEKPVTTRRQMAELATMQERVIDALRASGDTHVANRLERCMRARLGRRSDDGRPWTCRSPGCVWCGKTLMRRWWLGIERWVAENGTPVSIAVLPCPHAAGQLRTAVARLRRACRDIRDRTARRCARWGGVAVAGMVSGDGTALILVRHPGITRCEVADILYRRWPDAAVADVGSVSPSWRMSVEDAAEIARARRGVEPLRVIILAQRVHQRQGCPHQHFCAEPMPVVL